MLLGGNLNILLAPRKDLPITPSIKMKQLQWDKLPQQQVSKTFWSDEKPQQEQEMLHKLQNVGMLLEMEEDFKVKVINFISKFFFNKNDPLISLKSVRRRLSSRVSSTRKQRNESVSAIPSTGVPFIDFQL